MYDLEREIEHEKYKIKLREELRIEKSACDDLKRQIDVLKKQTNIERSKDISLLQFVTFFQTRKSNTKEIDIINLLLKDGYLIDINIPSYKSIENNLITSRVHVVDSAFGEVAIGTTHITTEGQRYFISKYACDI